MERMEKLAATNETISTVASGHQQPLPAARIFPQLPITMTEQLP